MHRLKKYAINRVYITKIAFYQIAKPNYKLFSMHIYVVA